MRENSLVLKSASTPFSNKSLSRRNRRKSKSVNLPASSLASRYFSDVISRKSVKGSSPVLFSVVASKELLVSLNKTHRKRLLQTWGKRKRPTRNVQEVCKYLQQKEEEFERKMNRSLKRGDGENKGLSKSPGFPFNSPYTDNNLLKLMKGELGGKSGNMKPPWNDSTVVSKSLLKPPDLIKNAKKDILQQISLSHKRSLSSAASPTKPSPQKHKTQKIVQSKSFKGPVKQSLKKKTEPSKKATSQRSASNAAKTEMIKTASTLTKVAKPKFMSSSSADITKVTAPAVVKDLRNLDIYLSRGYSWQHLESEIEKRIKQKAKNKRRPSQGKRGKPKAAKLNEKSQSLKKIKNVKVYSDLEQVSEDTLDSEEEVGSSQYSEDDDCSQVGDNDLLITENKHRENIFDEITTTVEHSVVTQIEEIPKVGDIKNEQVAFILEEKINIVSEERKPIVAQVYEDLDSKEEINRIVVRDEQPVMQQVEGNFKADAFFDIPIEIEDEGDEKVHNDSSEAITYDKRQDEANQWEGKEQIHSDELGNQCEGKERVSTEALEKGVTSDEIEVIKAVCQKLNLSFQNGKEEVQEKEKIFQTVDKNGEMVAEENSLPGQELDTGNTIDLKVETADQSTPAENGTMQKIEVNTKTLNGHDTSENRSEVLHLKKILKSDKGVQTKVDICDEILSIHSDITSSEIDFVQQPDVLSSPIVTTKIASTQTDSSCVHSHTKIEYATTGQATDGNTDVPVTKSGQWKSCPVHGKAHDGYCPVHGTRAEDEGTDITTLESGRDTDDNEAISTKPSKKGRDKPHRVKFNESTFYTGCKTCGHENLPVGSDKSVSKKNVTLATPPRKEKLPKPQKTIKVQKTAQMHVASILATEMKSEPKLNPLKRTVRAKQQQQKFTDNVVQAPRSLRKVKLNNLSPKGNKQFSHSATEFKGQQLEGFQRAKQGAVHHTYKAEFPDIKQRPIKYDTPWAHAHDDRKSNCSCKHDYQKDFASAETYHRHQARSAGDHKLVANLLFHHPTSAGNSRVDYNRLSRPKYQHGGDDHLVRSRNVSSYPFSNITRRTTKSEDVKVGYNDKEKGSVRKKTGKSTGGGKKSPTKQSCPMSSRMLRSKHSKKSDYVSDDSSSSSLNSREAILTKKYRNALQGFLEMQKRSCEMSKGRKDHPHDRNTKKSREEYEFANADLTATEENAYSEESLGQYGYENCAQNNIGESLVDNQSSQEDDHMNDQLQLSFGKFCVVISEAQMENCENLKVLTTGDECEIGEHRYDPGVESTDNDGEGDNNDDGVDYDTHTEYVENCYEEEDTAEEDEEEQEYGDEADEDDLENSQLGSETEVELQLTDTESDQPTTEQDQTSSDEIRGERNGAALGSYKNSVPGTCSDTESADDQQNSNEVSSCESDNPTTACHVKSQDSALDFVSEMHEQFQYLHEKLEQKFHVPRPPNKKRPLVRNLRRFVRSALGHVGEFRDSQASGSTDGDASTHQSSRSLTQLDLNKSDEFAHQVRKLFRAREVAGVEEIVNSLRSKHNEIKEAVQGDNQLIQPKETVS